MKSLLLNPTLKTLLSVLYRVLVRGSGIYFIFWLALILRMAVLLAVKLQPYMWYKILAIRFTL